MKTIDVLVRSEIFAAFVALSGIAFTGLMFALECQRRRSTDPRRGATRPDLIARIARRALRLHRVLAVICCTVLVGGMIVGMFFDAMVRWIVLTTIAVMAVIALTWKWRERRGSTGGQSRVPARRQAPDRLRQIHEVLDELAAKSPVQAELIRLHFFGGLSIDAAAGVLGILPTTAKRHLKYARAWIYRRITRGP